MPGLRQYLLPTFFYAGEISCAVEAPSLSGAQRIAVKELRVYLLWVLLQINVLNEQEVSWSLCYALRLPSHVRSNNMRVSYRTALDSDRDDYTKINEVAHMLTCRSGYSWPSSHCWEPTRHGIGLHGSPCCSRSKPSCSGTATGMRACIGCSLLLQCTSPVHCLALALAPQHNAS